MSYQSVATANVLVDGKQKVLYVQFTLDMPAVVAMISKANVSSVPLSEPILKMGAANIQGPGRLGRGRAVRV
jgi:hypothetical protein